MQKTDLAILAMALGVGAIAAYAIWRQSRESHYVPSPPLGLIPAVEPAPTLEPTPALEPAPAKVIDVSFELTPYKRIHIIRLYLNRGRIIKFSYALTGWETKGEYEEPPSFWKVEFLPPRGFYYSLDSAGAPVEWGMELSEGLTEITATVEGQYDFQFNATSYQCFQNAKSLTFTVHCEVL
jgi:hypothetical protein